VAAGFAVWGVVTGLQKLGFNLLDPLGEDSNFYPNEQILIRKQEDFEKDRERLYDAARAHLISQDPYIFGERDAGFYWTFRYELKGKPEKYTSRYLPEFLSCQGPWFR
jgi:hypothetical protein